MRPVKQNSAVVESAAFPGAEQLKRTRKYSAEWHEPPALTLDERGMIRDCSESGESLFGYRRHDDLIWQHISRLLPQLSGVALVLEGRINPLLNFLCRCGKLFETQNRLGDTFLSKLSFVQLEHDAIPTLRLIVCPSGIAKT